jgi:uncharacterized protein (DUF427 family)
MRPGKIRGSASGLLVCADEVFTKAKGDKRPIVIMTGSLTLTKEHNIGAMAEKIRAGLAHRTGIVSARTHSMERNGKMAVATWNGTVIAESEKTVVVEGNHYFPPESVNTQYLKPSTTTSRCPWKGLANYYSLIVDGKINEDAAWYYAKPSDVAAAIKGYIAFWKGVDVR